MEVIQSRINSDSDDYKQNFEANSKLVEELRENLRIAREDRSEKAYNRHTSQGKLPVRERIQRVLDPNTPFLELAPLAAIGDQLELSLAAVDASQAGHRTLSSGCGGSGLCEFVWGVNWLEPLDVTAGGLVSSAVTLDWGDSWHWTGQDDATGRAAWKCGDDGPLNYLARLDAGLVTPPIPVTRNAELHFLHRYDLEEATAADSQSYFWTNIAPQHEHLHDTAWGAIEDWMLLFADTSDNRASVFTGPIMSPDDPEHRNRPDERPIQIPAGFWKILALRHQGRLVAAGAAALTFGWLGGPGLTAGSAVWAALAAVALPGRRFGAAWFCEPGTPTPAAEEHAVEDRRAADRQSHRD